MTHWVFDDDVANNFDYIADTSIPKYRIVLYETMKLVEQGYDRESKIIEIGCASGNTLQLLKDRGYTNILGIDNSSAMINKCLSRGFRNLYLRDDFPTNESKSDVIIANWTLHFITDLGLRIEYIQRVYDNLKDNGMFVLTEKVSGDDSDYLEFKLGNHLSPVEILQKKILLKNVLITESEQWYLNTLREVGFKSVEVTDNTYCFRMFVVKK